MAVASILDAELTPHQRLLVTCLFVVVGLVIAVQVSQTQTEQPLRWARFTKETRSVQISRALPKTTTRCDFLISLNNPTKT